MKLSLSITNFSWRDTDLAAGLSRTARAADRGGFYGVWVADHRCRPTPSGPTRRDRDPGGLHLPRVPRRVHRARPARHAGHRGHASAPALLVKAVTTLDVLSGGRALFGIGAGYEGAEASAMGLPLPPVAERFARLEETLLIARQMWAGDESLFAGEQYRSTRPSTGPPTISQPHPPILVGGTGLRRTLPLVARDADACNVFDIPDGGATARHKLALGWSRVSRPHRHRTLSEVPGSGHRPRRRGRTGPWTDEAVATLAEAAPALDQLRLP